MDCPLRTKIHSIRQLRGLNIEVLLVAKWLAGESFKALEPYECKKGVRGNLRTATWVSGSEGTKGAILSKISVKRYLI
jgi:hypothetical protein